MNRIPGPVRTLQKNVKIMKSRDGISWIIMALKKYVGQKNVIILKMVK